MTSHDVQELFDVAPRDVHIIRVVSSVFFGLAVLTVGARLLCRKYCMTVGLGGDDAAIVFSLTCQVLAAVAYALLVHPLHHTEVGWTFLLRAAFASEILYTVSIFSTKLSLMLLYRRIFISAKIMKNSEPYLYIYNILWLIGTIVSLVLQCSPPRGFWNKLITSTCDVNNWRLYVGTSVPHALMDVILLLLPIIIVCRLNMSRTRKIQIAAMFLMGSIETAMSIVRMVFILDSHLSPGSDVWSAWSYYQPAFWSMLEVSLGIVAANLPTLRTLLQWRTGAKEKALFNSYMTSHRPEGASHKVRSDSISTRCPSIADSESSTKTAVDHRDELDIKDEGDENHCQPAIAEIV